MINKLIKKIGVETFIILYVSSFPLVIEFLKKLVPDNETYNNELFYANNICSIILFSIFLLNHIFFIKNPFQIALCIIYIHYTFMNTFYYHSVIQLELMKRIMWFYSTPIMTAQYCKINKLDLWRDTKFHYFLTTLTLTFLPQYNKRIELFFLAFLPYSKFMYNLTKYIYLPHTKIFLQIWFLFALVGAIQYLNIFPYDKLINVSLLLDSLAKGIWLLTLNEHQLNHNIESTDIESIHLLSSILKTINTFIERNDINENSRLISNNIKSVLVSHLPKNDMMLKTHLLKAILPYDFDHHYLMNNNITKKYDSICVFMTDIVGYSSLAKNYSEEVVYSILNEMYLRFDKVLKEFRSLQKIETIGDAYMIVGDLTEKYNSNIVMEQLIEISIRFINEIKRIEHSIYKLEIRIGISCGPVIIGILGNNIPRLSVIGNTVNMAARLQSCTVPDSICLSESAYNSITDKLKYNFIEKKDIELKNIGKMNTYILTINQK